jgi:hypothetical protein
MAIKKVIVTTPFPTVRRTARRLGVSKAETHRIEQLVGSVLSVKPRKAAAAAASARKRKKAGTVQVGIATTAP